MAEKNCDHTSKFGNGVPVKLPLAVSATRAVQDMLVRIIAGYARGSTPPTATDAFVSPWWLQPVAQALAG
ncbi:MAG: hypothetical protein EOP77_00340 [Variovorax sp.]|nr:MAG: hypothetical protein EOP77_00340 [Variovorax sp.]